MNTSAHKARQTSALKTIENQATRLHRLNRKHGGKCDIRLLVPLKVLIEANLYIPMRMSNIPVIVTVEADGERVEVLPHHDATATRFDCCMANHAPT